MYIKIEYKKNNFKKEKKKIKNEKISENVMKGKIKTEYNIK